MKSFKRRKDGENEIVSVHEKGRALLAEPILNKGSAFTPAERQAFGLTGLLPDMVSEPEEQVQRAYNNIARKESPLEKYIGLASLQDRNETLFFKLLLSHIEEFAPIVYTPTVGLACQRFSHIFRRGRGLWITPRDKGSILEVLKNAPFEDVRLIVVTDNERILGLGDLGAGGMGIPIGKLALYSVGAGIHPSQTLPISIDVGTNNKDMLDDPLYLGYKKERVRGAEYDAIVDEFVQAVKTLFPNALLQWEDFKKGNAFDLLDRYKDDLLSFNDDIQGTAAVALSGVLAACRKKGESLKDQRIAILGAGSAGIGIGRQLRDAFLGEGLTEEEAIQAVAIMDSKGLLIEGQNYSDVYKNEFAWPTALAEKHGLAGSDRKLDRVIEALHPTMLIGTSGQPKVFTEELIKAMYVHCDRPAIFPYSNPTANSEAIPADLLEWTDGKAIVATGSPFEPVVHKGKTHVIGQGNNVYIFPGVGLGALGANATKVTERMFTVAARELVANVTQSDLDSGSLYPRLNQLRVVSKNIALAVAKEAVRSGAAPKTSDEELLKNIENIMWTPEYATFEEA